MSNSGNPMQFIQRRGRVLRHAEGKDKATIHDMIVVPTMEPNDEIRQTEKKILAKELRRFEEFVTNAENEHSARNKIERLRTAYRI
jgi:superfamily II DNA or RNA helicase